MVKLLKQMENILINGGTGYLGGRLAEYFSELGYCVTISTRKKKYAYPGDTRVKVKFVDWQSTNSINKLCYGIDFVFHLSSPNSSEIKQNNFLVESSSTTTQNLMKSLLKNDVKKIIYFSSAHVYSSNLNGIIKESSLLKNNHPYAINHINNERIIQSYCKSNSLQSIILRVSNAFGHPIDHKANCWSLFANDICKQAVTTGKIILKSDGQQFRDFITINNLCRAAHHTLSIHDNENLLFNIGGKNSLNLISFLRSFTKRFYKRYNFNPEIILSKNLSITKNNLLEYKIDKIENTGFKLIKCFNQEIDALIVFCENFFINE